MFFDISICFNKQRGEDKMVPRFWCACILAVLMAGCWNTWNDDSDPQRGITTEPMSEGIGGSTVRFKVPVPTGYDWEVTQSWGEHCEYCNTKYHDWNYCDAEDMSHLGSCCQHSWDFNLPGNEDAGKPVLASGGGEIKAAGVLGGWGNSVVIDHGEGICTRYAHMVNGSIDHLTVGQSVCQGLKLGEIGETGEADGEHLHFQFEDCNTAETLEMGFDDGNDIPVCVRDGDRYDENGNYTALILSNQIRESCGGSDDVFGGGSLPVGGWYAASCGAIPGCPLNPNCDRSSGHVFTDDAYTSDAAASAASYLWGECVVDGKSDGGLHPLDIITRAEALKVSLVLFGLMDGCGGGESFTDVDREDWFFQVVVCAVSHGIIDTLNVYFTPNQQVVFGDAAEYLVKAAAQAGVIEIQNPAEGHFRNIARGDEAYRYVETIYAYGGIVNSLSLDLIADRYLRRSEFVSMAASLSPCFCSNVSCGGSCECVQESYACVDPYDSSVGTGGSDEEEEESDDEEVQVWVDGMPVDLDEEEEESDDEEEPESDDEEEESDDDEETSAVPPDVEISCFLDTDDTECGTETVFQIKCSVENNEDEVLKISNLVMHMTDEDDALMCQVTDPDLRSGVGTQNVEPDETRTPNGHFEVACESPPEDEELELSFDLLVRDAGVVTEFEELLETDLPLDAEDFDLCGSTTSEPVTPPVEAPELPPVEPPVYVDDFECDESLSQELWIYSPEGYLEIVASGEITYLEDGPLPDEQRILYMDCADFPVAVLIRGGPEGIMVSKHDMSNFEVWTVYAGEVTLSPPYPSDLTTPAFSSDMPGLNLLIRAIP